MLGWKARNLRARMPTLIMAPRRAEVTILRKKVKKLLSDKPSPRALRKRQPGRK